jgi:hypothetical protein
MRPVALFLFITALAPLLPAADDPKLSEDFPRRALFIQVNHYLYLNPLTSATVVRNREVIDRFAATLHVPTWKTNNQLFILSDNLPPTDDRAPTKSAIQAAVRRFCETSRAQDRIFLYFHGHAFEKNDKAFFAPVEGEAANLQTLVPIAEIYDMVKGCKATQKIIVWDVCPRNPERTAIRPKSGPMTLELFLALMATPPGVQAVVSCLPSEYSLEYTTPKGDAGSVAGSALFDAIRKACEDTAATKRAAPADPLPIVEAFPKIEKYLDSATKALGTKQTVKLVGNPVPMLAAIDPNAPLPATVLFPAPKSPTTAELRGILQEIALPPLVIGEGVDPFPPLVFDSIVLKSYLPDISADDILRDSEKYPLRVAVLRSLQTIRNTMPIAGPKDVKPISFVTSPVADQQKKAVLNAQAPMAVAIAKLEDELTALEAVEKLRTKETKRWQANFDYTLGQLRMRLAFLNEYNLALGHVRTEALPELPTGSTAWRLTFADKMLSKKNVQELAAAARSAFEAVIANHKGTPWEVLAKRAMFTPPGLRWEPVTR